MNQKCSAPAIKTINFDFLVRQAFVNIVQSQHFSLERDIPFTENNAAINNVSKKRIIRIGMFYNRRLGTVIYSCNLYELLAHVLMSNNMR